METALTMSQVAELTGLHKNTIRKYVKRGEIKASLVGDAIGKQKWVITKEDLYGCGIPEITRHLDPREMREAMMSEKERKKRVENQQIAQLQDREWKLMMTIEEKDIEINS